MIYSKRFNIWSIIVTTDTRNSSTSIILEQRERSTFIRINYAGLSTKCYVKIEVIRAISRTYRYCSKVASIMQAPVPQQRSSWRRERKPPSRDQLAKEALIITIRIWNKLNHVLLNHSWKLLNETVWVRTFAALFVIIVSGCATHGSCPIARIAWHL